MRAMFADMDWSRAIEVLRCAQHVLLTTHRNPDGDGIGAQLALFHALRGMGKQVSMFNRDGVPRIYRFLVGANEIAAGDEPVDHGADVVVSLDCGSARRLGVSAGFFTGATHINIDHHRSNQGFGDVRCVDARYCATGAMVADLLLAMNVPFTPEIASALYTSLLTDTGSFRLSNCTADVYRLAEALVRAGADPSYIARHVYEAMRPAALRLLGRCLQDMTLRDAGRSAWMVVTQSMFAEVGADVEDTEGLIDYARSVDGVEVAVLIREDLDVSGCWKVSFRGKTYADVGSLAERLGGGGHRHAAGCQLRGTREEIAARLFP
ncbi:MAG: DHH family/DHHA1 domain protein, partial [Zetaproteobacteria bacterium]